MVIPSGVDIVPCGSNCCLQIFGWSDCSLNFALWFSIAINREIHKASTVMDILYMFIWLPDINTQNYCCPANNFNHFICGGSNWRPKFTWWLSLLAALCCVYSGTLFTPASNLDKIAPNLMIYSPLVPIALTSEGNGVWGVYKITFWADFLTNLAHFVNLPSKIFWVQFIV